MRVIPIIGGPAGPMTGRGTNAYLIPGARPTLIDAPEASDAFVDRVAEALEIEQPGMALSQVLVTHFHHDHIDGVEALAKRWPDVTFAKFPFAEDATHGVTWTPLADGQTVAAGDSSLRVLHTPGHAPDHVALFESGPASCSAATCSSTAAPSRSRRRPAATSRCTSPRCGASCRISRAASTPDTVRRWTTPAP